MVPSPTADGSVPADHGDAPWIVTFTDASDDPVVRGCCKDRLQCASSTGFPCRGVISVSRIVAAVKDQPELCCGQRKFLDPFDEPVTMLCGPPLTALPCFEESRVQDVEAVDQPAGDIRRQGAGLRGTPGFGPSAERHFCGGSHGGLRIRVRRIRATAFRKQAPRRQGCLRRPRPTRTRNRSGRQPWQASRGIRARTGAGGDTRNAGMLGREGFRGSAAGGRGVNPKGSPLGVSFCCFDRPTLACGRDGCGHTREGEPLPRGTPLFGVFSRS